MRMKAALLGIFLLLVSTQAATGEVPTPRKVRYDLHVETEWTELPSSPDRPEDKNATLTRSAVRVRRAVDPGSKEPYAPGRAFDCDVKDLRRSFRLEKKDLLLGEPILVALHVELQGRGVWREKLGGNYDARGRDGNFYFVMRHDDGSWVADPCGRVTSYMGGGMTHHEVRRGSPCSIWNAVQERCAIDRPGVYELYCLAASHAYHRPGILISREAAVAGLAGRIPEGHILCKGGGWFIDERTGKMSRLYDPYPTCKYLPQTRSPVVKHVPAEVVARLKSYWRIDRATDFARFRITVKEGTPAERRQMVGRWTRIAGSGPWHQMVGSRARAASDGITLARQDDFVPLVAKWIADPDRASQRMFNGLVMRGTPAAMKLIRDSDNWLATYALRHVRRERIPEAIPRLIESLTHPESRARAYAESTLHEWTGKYFQHTWRGFDSRRPTPEEGRKMQTLWRKWWDENSRTFGLQTP